MLLKKLLILVMIIGSLFGYTLTLPSAEAESAGANTHYVTTNGNCGNVSPCYSSLQEAVLAANQGDVIKVAAGTYTGFGTSIVIIDRTVTIAGGYTTTDWQTADPTNNPTILDSQNISGRQAIIIDAETLYPTVITGLTVQNSTGEILYSDAAGIRVTSGQVQIINVIVQNNTVGIFGSAKIQQSIIQDNEVGIRAASVAAHQNLIQNNFRGIFLFPDQNESTITDNIIKNSSRGIAIERGNDEGQITIADNLIHDNFRGISIYCDATTGIIHNNIIRDNQHAIRLAQVRDFSITQNQILDNSGDSGGGIIIINEPNRCSGIETQITINQNTFMGNDASKFGNVIYMKDEESFNGLITVFADNNIIANNGSSGTAVFVSNSILNARHWTLTNSGEVGILAEENGVVTISNSIVSEQTVAAFNGVGVTADTILFHNNGRSCMDGAVCHNELHGDPQLKTTANGPFHIDGSSAAINQATSLGPTEDIDGDMRPLCGGYDLGADEYDGSAEPLPNLQLSNILTSTDMFTATLTWPLIDGATDYELRYADTLIHNGNWEKATLLTQTLTDTTTYTATVPFGNSGHIYFAIRYNGICGLSNVSPNSFWPQQATYLPFIGQE